MPGEEPKGQHFVHRAYLEGFLDPASEKTDKPFLWLYMPNKSPFPQRTERVAKRNYYYCFRNEERRQFIVEHGLQQLESVASPVLQQLQKQQFALSEQDRLTFAGYVALAHVRVPTFEKATDHAASLLYARLLEFIANDKNGLAWVASKFREDMGDDINVEELRELLTGGACEVAANRAFTLRMMVQMLLPLQRVIFLMNWSFLIAPPDDDGFLTSDNPVGLFDPTGNQLGGVGFASSPEAHFIFPISRGICLLAQHRTGRTTIAVNGSQVRRVNRLLIERVGSQLYAPFRSSYVQGILDSVVAKRPNAKKVMFKKGRAVEECG